MEIPRIARYLFKYLENNNLLTDEWMEKFCDEDYCRTLRICSYAILKIVDEHYTSDKMIDLETFTLKYKGHDYGINRNFDHRRGHVVSLPRWFEQNFHVSPLVAIFDGYVRDGELSTVLSEKNFRYDNARQCLEQIDHFDFQDTSLENLYNKFLKTSLSVKEYFKTVDGQSTEFRFLELCINFIDHIESHRSPKLVDPDIWMAGIYSRLGIKIARCDERVLRAFNFLNDPINSLPVMTSGQRKILLRYLFKTDKSEENFDREVLTLFKNIPRPENNFENFTLSILDFLERKEILEIWNPNNYVEEEMEETKNIIYYGVPGTGKTYKFQHEICKQFEPRIKSELLDEYNLDDIIAFILANNDAPMKTEDIANHFLVTQKFKNQKKFKSDDILRSVKEVLSSNLVSDDEHANKIAPYSFNQNASYEWSLSSSSLQSECQEKYNNLIENRFAFVTFHPNFSYEDFIEGIKPELREDNSGSISYKIEDGIFKKLCDQAAKDPDHKYAIMIDEINRGNIPAIFGELITLIEEDKREKVKVVLPYSKKTFTVPRNVYIYGSMNTADRSVEALDAALRRRFKFIACSPDPSCLHVTDDKINLVEILKTINDRLNVMIGSDFEIGHTYFLNARNIDDVRVIFENKIIPLLNEYLFGDMVRLSCIIGTQFFKTVSIKFPDAFENYTPDTSNKYQLIKSSEWTVEMFNSIC